MRLRNDGLGPGMCRGCIKDPCLFGLRFIAGLLINTLQLLPWL